MGAAVLVTIGLVAMVPAVFEVVGRAVTGYWSKPLNFWPKEKRERFINRTIRRVRMGEMRASEALECIHEHFGWLHLHMDYSEVNYRAHNAEWLRDCERHGWPMRPLRSAWREHGIRDD